jgi:hypothetical protein
LLNPTVTGNGLGLVIVALVIVALALQTVRGLRIAAMDVAATVIQRGVPRPMQGRTDRRRSRQTSGQGLEPRRGLVSREASPRGADDPPQGTSGSRIDG